MILALNTASRYTEIALLDSREILFEKSWLAQKDEAEKLLPALQEAFKKSGKSFKKLDGIFCVVGPGAFTGLRIGVAIANALAFSQNIPIYHCDVFKYSAHQNLKGFGNTVQGLLKIKLKKSGQVRPLYLREPNITKSKKYPLRSQKN